MRRIFLLVLLCCFSFGLYAQRAAIKTNLLQWGTATPNLGAEFVLSKHLSFNFEAGFNPVKAQKTSLRHAIFQPEIRYWTGRALSRHFIGVMAGISTYNLLWKETYRRGNAWTAGITYGYDFVLSQHWNLELTAGVGCLSYKQYKYLESERNERHPATRHYTPAPLKVGVSFIYIIK